MANSKAMANTMSNTMADTFSHSNSSWVDSLIIIDHLGDISIYIVGVVVGCLRAAVGDGNRVGSLPGGGAVVSGSRRERRPQRTGRCRGWPRRPAKIYDAVETFGLAN